MSDTAMYFLCFSTAHTEQHLQTPRREVYPKTFLQLQAKQTKAVSYNGHFISPYCFLSVVLVVHSILNVLYKVYKVWKSKSVHV